MSLQRQKERAKNAPVGAIEVFDAEKIRRQCAQARAAEECADYELAATIMDGFWRGVGRRPRGLDALEERSQADVLLRIGVLTRELGGARQVDGALEAAKELIGESQRIYESLKETEKVAECQTEIGFCYWRAGASDEARIHFRDALRLLKKSKSVQKAITLLRIATVETRATRYDDALRILMDEAAFFERVGDHNLRGRFHNTLAVNLKNLYEGHELEEHSDRALEMYEAAAFHFEQAGNRRFLAFVENNFGYLLFLKENFAEAHRHLNRARRLFEDLGDRGAMAQVDDTRARAFCAQGRYEDSERIARIAVGVLEQGEELGLLADTLITHAVALTHLNRNDKSLDAFRRAVEVALQAGDQECAGRACLGLMESFKGQMTAQELSAAYQRADELLDKTQHLGTLRRLRACARAVAQAAAKCDGRSTALMLTIDESCNLKEEVLQFERTLIKRALDLTGNKIRAASRLLGMKTHQTLSLALHERHKELLNTIRIKEF